MTAKKSMWVLFSILVTSAWILGSAIQVEAETMNYKLYTYVIKSESVPVEDVEGHAVGFVMRGNFLQFENGEIATANQVGINDYIKGSGTFMQYVTINFADGSTIIIKSQGTTAGAAGASPASGAMKSEIIKGTGRFEGITGTQSSRVKYLPREKGEIFPRGYGEGTITYTLPTK